MFFTTFRRENIFLFVKKAVSHLKNINTLVIMTNFITSVPLKISFLLFCVTRQEASIKCFCHIPNYNYGEKLLIIVSELWAELLCLSCELNCFCFWYTLERMIEKQAITIQTSVTGKHFLKSEAQSVALRKTSDSINCQWYNLSFYVKITHSKHTTTVV